jgi:hypothetical protein
MALLFHAQCRRNPANAFMLPHQRFSPKIVHSSDCLNRPPLLSISWGIIRRAPEQQRVSCVLTMGRIYRRVPLNHPAVIAVNPAAHDERIYLVRTSDISASGALFCSDRQFSPGTPVKAVFILKRQQPQNHKLKVEFTGRVIRCEPRGFAVAFDDVHPITIQSMSQDSQDT